MIYSITIEIKKCKKVLETCLVLVYVFVKLVILLFAGGAFGGNRGLRPVPPEKGIFPLDHMHLCDLVYIILLIFIHKVVAYFCLCLVYSFNKLVLDTVVVPHLFDYSDNSEYSLHLFAVID